MKTEENKLKIYYFIFHKYFALLISDSVMRLVRFIISGIRSLIKTKLGIQNLNLVNLLHDLVWHTESWINFLQVWVAQKRQSANAEQSVENV